MSSSITIEKSGGVWTIILYRPKRKNAVDNATASKLYDAFVAFEASKDAKVAVLYGAGGTFCSGYDLKSLAESGSPDFVSSETKNDDVLNSKGPMGPTRLQLTKPVIAAVSGVCCAGGLELALWCDMRVVEDNAVFGVFCRRWGVPLIDGGTVRLPRLIGQSRALDMILTGRPVNAHEALSIGLANRVVPVSRARYEAELLAHSIKAFPEECMRADRLSVYTQHNKTLGQALTREFTTGAPMVAREGLRGAREFSSGRGRSGAFEPVTHPGHRFKCVFFDLGGVVFDSPFKAIIAHAKAKRLDGRVLNQLFVRSTAFDALERGLLSLQDFIAAFQAECDAEKLPVNAQELFAQMTNALKPRRQVLDCIQRLRAGGLKVAALTNNWRKTNRHKDGDLSALKPHFDDIIESCVEGVRKPDPRIFHVALSRLQVTGSDSIFLDDIGQNLKAAKKQGFTCIKVNFEYLEALQQLQELVPHIDLQLQAKPKL